MANFRKILFPAKLASNLVFIFYALTQNTFVFTFAISYARKQALLNQDPVS